jgi:hypothetical protein
MICVLRGIDVPRDQFVDCMLDARVYVGGGVLLGGLGAIARGGGLLFGLGRFALGPLAQYLSAALSALWSMGSVASILRRTVGWYGVAGSAGAGFSSSSGMKRA